jgi:hypothetical protein
MRSNDSLDIAHSIALTPSGARRNSLEEKYMQPATLGKKCWRFFLVNYRNIGGLYTSTASALDEPSHPLTGQYWLKR